MSQTILALREFFLREVPRLPQSYNWKIPLIAGFAQAGHVGYQANLDLKAHFKKQWAEATHDGKLRIAKQIVSDWGGIHSNRPATIEKYVRVLLSEAEPLTPLQGIASYSKIFAVVDPDQFAIYDARVAACLNAVQINAKVSRGVAFNYVSGRNNIVGNKKTKKGFTLDTRFLRKTLVSSGWEPVKQNETYQKYLDILKLCQTDIPNFSLVSLEMALFANAEHECLRATQQAQSGSVG